MSRHRSLNWNDLRMFLEVARQGHLSSAAKRLNVDHSTVSRRIAQLELALGTKLFDRTRSGLALCDAGRQLLRHAEAIESHTLSASKSFGFSDGEGGAVRIAMMEGIASLYLALRLGRLQASHPSIKLELVTSAQPFNLSRREADLFLSFFKPASRGLHTQKIGEFELRLYASPGYIKRHGMPAKIEELTNHAFVDYIGDLVAIDAVRWLGDVIKNPHIVFHSNSMIAQHQAAVAGLGLVLLPSFAAARDKRLKPVLVGKVSVKRDLWLSVHHDLQDIPRVKAVTQFIAKLVREDQDFLNGLAS